MQTIIELDHLSYKQRLERQIDRLLTKAKGLRFAGYLEEYNETINEADKAAKQLSRLTNWHANCQT